MKTSIKYDLLKIELQIARIYFFTFQKCETQGVNHCEDKEECTTKYVMQCTPTGLFEEPTPLGYVKEHCDYQPKEECQTVSYMMPCTQIYIITIN